MTEAACEPCDRPGRDARALHTPRTRFFMVAMLAWSAAMVVYTITSGIRFYDHIRYLEMWSLVRSGNDPWAEDHTYGPLFNPMAYLVELDRLGPKVFMACAFLVVNLLLVRELLSRGPSRATLLAYVILIPANLMVIGVVASYGLNDTLVAALVGLATLMRFRRKFVLVGVFLGLAVLLKYHPALLVPFFCLDRRRFEVQPLLAAAGTVVAGFLIALPLWGDGFVASWTEGASRRPKLLSVLSAWSSHPDFYGNSRIADFLIRNNAAFVVIGCVAAFLLAYAFRLSWIEGSFIGAWTYLLVYKVGHHTYYVPVLFLAVGLLIAGTPRSRWLAFCFLPFALFLSLFQLGYEWLTDAYTSTARDVRFNVGYFAFGLGCATIATFLVGARLRPDTLGRDVDDEPDEPVGGSRSGPAHAVRVGA